MTLDRFFFVSPAEPWMPPPVPNVTFQKVSGTPLQPFIYLVASSSNS